MAWEERKEGARGTRTVLGSRELPPACLLKLALALQQLSLNPTLGRYELASVQKQLPRAHESPGWTPGLFLRTWSLVLSEWFLGCAGSLKARHQDIRRETHAGSK